MTPTNNIISLPVTWRTVRNYIEAAKLNWGSHAEALANTSSYLLVLSSTKVACIWDFIYDLDDNGNETLTAITVRSKGVDGPLSMNQVLGILDAHDELLDTRVHVAVV